MKIRFSAIAIIALSAIGLILFATTPLVYAKETDSGTGDPFLGDYTLTVSISCKGFGNGKIRTEGTSSTMGDLSDSDNIEADDWLKDFPIVVPILTTIGLSLAFIGGILSLFGYNKLLLLIGAILGILGGVLAFVGMMLFLDFGSWFIDTGAGLEQSTYHAGFFIPVIFSGLIAIGSVLLLIIKPKGMPKKEIPTI